MEKLSSDIIRKKEQIEENYKIIKDNIAQAAIKSGRKPEDIKLLAATKTVSPVLINHAISLGVDLIGENRVQELLTKIDDINKQSTDIHFIGHLQTNKVKKIVGNVSLIQSVDSVKLAREISETSIKKNIVTDVLVEVNVGNENNKSGVLEDYLEECVLNICEFKGINIKGLMTIPPICKNSLEVRKYFSKLYKLFVDIGGKKIDNINMNILSMGMSSDYCDAILEGASMVRIGSALFGMRNY